MRKALGLIGLLLTITLLSGCGHTASLGERAFVLVMALDVVGDGQLRIAVQISSGTRSLNESGTGGSSAPEGSSTSASDSSGTPANPSVQQGAYYLISATGDSYAQALALLHATIPRKLDFSHMREVIVGEALARAEAFPSLVRAVLSTRSVRPSALLVVAQNDARYFTSLQQPYLGSRLSQYIDMRIADAKHFGFIHDATLAETWESLHTHRMDALVSYAAADNFDVPRALTPGRILDDLPGHLPRSSINHTEYLGAALFDDQHMVATVTGFGAQMTHILRGTMEEVFYLLDRRSYVLTQRRPARQNVIRQGAQTVLQVEMWLAAIPSEMSSKPDLAVLQTQLTRDLTDQLLFYQSVRADPVGFGRYAVRFFPTQQAWDAHDWRSEFANAALDVDVHVELSNAI